MYSIFFCQIFEWGELVFFQNIFLKLEQFLFLFLKTETEKGGYTITIFDTPCKQRLPSTFFK